MRAEFLAPLSKLMNIDQAPLVEIHIRKEDSIFSYSSFGKKKIIRTASMIAQIIALTPKSKTGKGADIYIYMSMMEKNRLERRNI